MGSLQPGNEFGAEHPTEDLDRQEEPIAGLDPAFVIEGQAPSRNHTMNVWMGPQVWSTLRMPISAPRPRCLGIGGDFQQRCGARSKQKGVEDFLVVKG
jgi:hypothetical protein